METRQLKGLQIAARCKIRRDGFSWVVPSESGSGKYYVTLNGEQPHCTCLDFETRGMACKHVYAAQCVLERQEGEGIAKRKTYSQDWPAYNAAQTNEKRHFQVLLHDLCSSIEESPQLMGRPRLPLADALFSAVFKVYSTVSGRRFMCDLGDAFDRGHISRLPHYNSIFNYLEKKELTPLLHEMIQVSSLPLKAIETDFAVDSSGFSTSRFIRWYDQKYGAPRVSHDWVKCHIMCGVKTNVITAVEIAGRNANDNPMLPGLVNKTAENFRLNEVSADMGYLSSRNMMCGRFSCRLKPQPQCVRNHIGIGTAVWDCRME